MTKRTKGGFSKDPTIRKEQEELIRRYFRLQDVMNMMPTKLALTEVQINVIEDIFGRALGRQAMEKMMEP